MFVEDKNKEEMKMYRAVVGIIFLIFATVLAINLTVDSFQRTLVREKSSSYEVGYKDGRRYELNWLAQQIDSLKTLNK